jgi:hypothetical protein
MSLPGITDLLAASAGRFTIGACDWSIGMRGRTGAMSLAREFGIDGAQISMGGVENDLHLRRPDVQRAYREAAAAHGVRIAGIGLDIMNEVPYKSDPRTIQWVSDSIDVARALDVRVVLLAFFVKGDLKTDPEGQAEVIRRLRAVAPKAEGAGVTLGIESWLSADEHMRIIDAVKSPNVKVYYDVANSQHMGYDIYSEIRMGSCWARDESTSRGFARLSSISATRGGSRSRGPSLKASRCSRATSRMRSSCAGASRRGRLACRSCEALPLGRPGKREVHEHGDPDRRCTPDGCPPVPA